MVKLPSYDNRQGLDIGSAQLSPDLGAPIARGVQQFGEGLLNAGERIAKAQRGIADRDDAYRDEIEMIRLGDRIQQFSLEQADKMPEDGSGYARSVENFARTEYDKMKLEGRFSGGNQVKHDLMFERLRNGIVDAAAKTEFAAKLKFRDGVLERGLKDAIGFVSATGKDGLEPAIKNWSDFVERTEGMNSRRGKILFDIGQRRINEQALRAQAAKDPINFIGGVQGAFTDTPSATTNNAWVNASLKHATANNVDPSIAVALNWIESRNGDPKHSQRPRRKDGSQMSSADGGWQILDELKRAWGLSREDAYDPEKASAAVMKHFGRLSEQLKNKGLAVTPGRMGILWTLGEGDGWAVLRADPNASFADIIRSRYRSNPGRGEDVIRNNPTYYNGRMTAGQVIASFENEVAKAQKATAKYFNASVSSPALPVGTADGVVDDGAEDNSTGKSFMNLNAAREFASKFMGRDMSMLGNDEIMSVFADTNKNLKELTAKERKILDGGARLRGEIVGDPYDSEHKGSVNEYIKANVPEDVVRRMASGDQEALREARQITQNAKFVPDRYKHGYQAALDSGQTEPIVLALTDMAFLKANNPQAYEASEFKTDDKEAVNTFTALTRVLGFDPASAAKQVAYYRTTEGKKAREVLADRAKAEDRDAGVTALQSSDAAWTKIQQTFDNSYFSTPGAVSDVQRELMVDAYRRGVLYERLQGYPKDVAEARTLEQIGKIWGVSSVAAGGGQTMMPLAPEKVFAGQEIQGSHQWVRTQAQNRLMYSLARDGLIENIRDDTGYFPAPNASVPEFRLVPAPGAMNDYLQGRPVTYDIMYKDKKGMIQFLIDHEGRGFKPDYMDAKRNDDWEFRHGRQNRRGFNPVKAALDTTDAVLSGFGSKTDRATSSGRASSRDASNRYPAQLRE